MLGEHNRDTDPDCENCSKLQTFQINTNDIIVHEDWDRKNVATKANDIALIRLPRLAETYIENHKTPVLPICLGWKTDFEIPTDYAQVRIIQANLIFITIFNEFVYEIITNFFNTIFNRYTIAVFFEKFLNKSTQLNNHISPIINNYDDYKTFRKNNSVLREASMKFWLYPLEKVNIFDILKSN